MGLTASLCQPPKLSYVDLSGGEQPQNSIVAVFADRPLDSVGGANAAPPNSRQPSTPDRSQAACAASSLGELFQGALIGCWIG
jgi:hypothetical protein